MFGEIRHAGPTTTEVRLPDAWREASVLSRMFEGVSERPGNEPAFASRTEIVSAAHYLVLRATGRPVDEVRALIRPEIAERVDRVLSTEGPFLALLLDPEVTKWLCTEAKVLVVEAFGRGPDGIPVALPRDLAVVACDLYERKGDTTGLLESLADAGPAKRAEFFGRHAEDLTVLPPKFLVDYLPPLAGRSDSLDTILLRELATPRVREYLDQWISEPIRSRTDHVLWRRDLPTREAAYRVKRLLAKQCHTDSLDDHFGARDRLLPLLSATFGGSPAVAPEVSRKLSRELIAENSELSGLVRLARRGHKGSSTKALEDLAVEMGGGARARLGGSGTSSRCEKESSQRGALTARTPPTSTGG